MERGTYHHGDLAAVLLATGLELLESEGAERLSLRALARAAGVSPNAPYRHYADKEDLLAALAAEGYADVRTRLAEITTGSRPERVVAVVQRGVAFAVDRPQVFRLMAGHVCSTHPTAVAAMNEVLATVVAILGGEHFGPAEQALCTGIWALTQGLSTLLIDGNAHPAPGETTEEYVARVVGAVAGSGP